MMNDDWDRLNKDLKTFQTLSILKKRQVREKVQKAIKESNQLFKKNIQNLNADFKSLNLIVGMTGAGKSTLFNYLKKIPLIMVTGIDPNGEKNGYIKLDIDRLNLQQSQTFALIGHGFLSQTTMPNFYKSVGENVTYVDCSAEFHNNDIMQSIISSYIKYDLAMAAQEVKLTLVIKYNDIFTNRAIVFRQISKEVGKFIGNWKNFIQSESISLVFTAAPSSKDTIDHLLLALKQIAQQVQDLGQFKYLLQSVVKRKAIAILQCPYKKITNLQEISDAGGEMLIAKYQIPQGKPYTPDPRYCSPDIISQILGKVKFMKKGAGLFENKLQKNVQIAVNFICESLIQDIKMDLLKIIISNPLGIVMCKTLQDTKRKICQNIQKVDECHCVQQIIQLFRINPALLKNYFTLSQDLSHLNKISSIVNLEEKLIQISKDIKIQLFKELNKITQHQLREAIQINAQNEKKLFQLKI